MNTISGTTDKAEAQHREGREGHYREGRVARLIEQQTAKVPSDVFLWAAGASIIGSLVFQVMGARRRTFLGSLLGIHTATPMANFIGMWTPTLLLLGVYNKMTKMKMGSESQSGGNR